MATITNLIPVPKMTSGWTVSGSASPGGLETGYYSIALTGTTSTAEVTVNTTGTIPLNNTHIYYVRYYGYQTTKTNASVGCYWPIAEPSFRDGLPIKDAGGWRLYSARMGRSSFSNGNYQLRLDFNNGNQSGTMYFSCPMLIDLTAGFGAGSEPTQEWCDANIPFFEGSLGVNAIGPVILSAEITPNPVNVNANFVLTASVTEAFGIQSVGLWRSGETQVGLL